MCVRTCVWECVCVPVNAPGAWSVSDVCADPGIRHKVTSNIPGAGKERGVQDTPRRTEPRTPRLKRGPGPRPRAAASSGFFPPHGHTAVLPQPPLPARTRPGHAWRAAWALGARLAPQMAGRAACPRVGSGRRRLRSLRRAFYLGRVGGHPLGVISQAVGALKPQNISCTCSPVRALG